MVFRATILMVLLAAMWTVGARLAHAQQGPASVADLADRLSPAVVNISTRQKVEQSEGVPMPQVPEGTPFREFFEEFFKRQ